MIAGDLPAHRLKHAKRALRRAVLERRDALAPEDRAERSRRIVDRLFGLPEMIGARTVMTFWSFGSEVDTAPLLDRLHGSGRRVLLPRIDGGEIVAIVYAPGDEVTSTRFGAMEPARGDAVDPENVDLVIVPGVAFDRRGGRVGYGGGFYDRFLRRTRDDVPAIAIAFSVQIVDEVPEGAMDRRLDAIVNEEATIRCRSG